jgi:hypothetical protein
VLCYNYVLCYNCFDERTVLCYNCFDERIVISIGLGGLGGR